jgi:trehalose synthase
MASRSTTAPGRALFTSAHDHITSGIASRGRSGWPILIAALCAVTAGCRSAPAGPKVHRDSDGDEGPDYIRWLEQRSMLFQAGEMSALLEGKGAQWLHPYSEPQAGEVVKAHSVWLLHYPGSVITRPGESVIHSWGDPQLWDQLRDIGIDVLHTCPTLRAGGIVGRHYTPTIDGWFDRISQEIDPQLGTEEEFRRMVRVAGERGGLIAGDLVPLHTGMGPDFRLAERAYKDYDGMFTMVEIGPVDWPLLPEVIGPWSTALVPRETAILLEKKGYIPGLIASADAHPQAKTWSGWSATGEVVGVDGRTRRWVYLHVFKPQQPVLNWLDPSYAARRVVAGDAVRSIYDLGQGIVRLDAVPFLGIEPVPGEVMASSYMNPLSVIGTNDLAFMVRKLGGWSFQELNVPLKQLKEFTQHGADLSYDFFTRAQVLSPLLSADARPLRLAHRLLLELGVQSSTLLHDLQNHDEITFQLVDLGARDEVQLDGHSVSGKELKEQILEEMRSKVAGPAAPYNRLYRQERDGVATTFAGFAAAALGIRDPYHATPDQIAMIQRAHLLFAHANAMQPGVFALSSWDLVGALPIPEDAVADRTKDGDYRWLNRGGVDLLGVNPGAKTSAFGLPRATALYGSLPEQLKSPGSFLRQLERMLAARKKYRLPESAMVAVPAIKDQAICVLVMKLPDPGNLAITVLNYARAGSVVDVDLASVPGMSVEQLRRQTARDIVSEQDVGVVSEAGHLMIDLDALSGRTVVLQRR